MTAPKESDTTPVTVAVVCEYPKVTPKTKIKATRMREHRTFIGMRSSSSQIVELHRIHVQYRNSLNSLVSEEQSFEQSSYFDQFLMPSNEETGPTHGGGPRPANSTEKSAIEENGSAKFLVFVG
jgi:hypothetical protein